MHSHDLLTIHTILSDSEQDKFCYQFSQWREEACFYTVMEAYKGLAMTTASAEIEMLSGKLLCIVAAGVMHVYFT